MKPSRQLSLLVVSHSYPPVLGGSEVELQRVCKSLLDRGHSVQVLCAGCPPMPRLKEWVDTAGIPVRIIGRGPVRWRDFCFAAGVAWAILKDRRKYDAVYFLMQGLHLAAGLPVARLRGIPVVMKFSGSSIITMLQESWLGRLEIGMLRRWAKRVMFLNDGMRNEALRAGLPGEQLEWMPNPVDTAQFAPVTYQQQAAIRRELDIPADMKVALFVGRLAPEKELAGLIRAFAQLDDDQAQLILVGEGPERPALELCATNAGLRPRTIRFAGRVPIESVPKWLAASDVFTLVSSNEGFPCSLLEAMSSGIASLVSDIPANLQLITDDSNGLIAEQGNESAISGALKRLFSDPHLRARLGTAARAEVAGKYSMEEIAMRYESVFEEVLSA